MPSVKRNDPCPCGSGRKYKNCCMRQDRIAASRDLNLRGGEAALLNALYDHAQLPRFGTDTAEAFNFYWGGRFNLDGLVQAESEDVRRTIEWFIHDYQTGSNRGYVIDHFIETKAADLPAEAQNILEAWSRSMTGLYRVLDLSEGDRLSLYDCLRKEELQATDAMLSRNTWRGDLLVGRLFELDEVKRLSLMTMILPAEYEPGLVEYVTNAYRLYQEQHHEATWDEFLRENGHIFNAYLLSHKAEALRSLIGPGTRFRDPAVTRDKMREFTSRRAKELGEESAAAKERAPQVHRTEAGIIVPGAAPTESTGQKEAEPADQEQERAAPSILIPGRDF